VRQAKIVIHLEHGQLLMQPGFMFAQGIDAPTDRRHTLAQVQVQDSASSVIQSSAKKFACDKL
jgi:hypothetical protein